MTKEVKFKNPSFAQRIKGMLGVDFYRLFHTPMFYIFLGIAAIIPALVSMGGGEGASIYTTAWQIIAASEPLYVVKGIADYANMNMVFIFGGIMVSIFIGHDYKSGYVKQLFTTHAKKQDYMLSKALVSAFAMACMCVTYLIGGTVSGLLSGLSLKVNVGSLIIAILSKDGHEPRLGKPLYLSQCHFQKIFWNFNCILLLLWNRYFDYRCGGYFRKHFNF